jgi:hypothetical protein
MQISQSHTLAYRACQESYYKIKLGDSRGAWKNKNSVFYFGK